jgi:hypothetical protein
MENEEKHLSEEESAELLPSLEEAAAQKPDMVESVKSRMTDVRADFPLLDAVDVQEDARLKGTA